ncbi:MAG: carbon storage regulator CsrA [Selenomonadaceae bacterium]|nr:carbon storage regulator CsrA [Selenomonadaceae bacterium]
MLVLTRKPRQQIMIGDDIVINVVEVQGENVRIAIDAPREIKIYRGEIYRAIQEENQKAAAQIANVDLHNALPLK